MREVAKSTQLRLKVFVFALVSYLCYETTAIPHILHAPESKVEAFWWMRDEEQVILYIGAVLRMIAFFVCLWFCYRVLIEYQRYSKNQKWLMETTRLTQISMGFWVTSVVVEAFAFVPRFIVNAWFLELIILFIFINLTSMNKLMPIWAMRHIMFDINGDWNRIQRLKAYNQVIGSYAANYLVILLTFSLINPWLLFSTFIPLTGLVMVWGVTVQYTGCCRNADGTTGCDCGCFEKNCCERDSSRRSSIMTGAGMITIIAWFIVNNNTCFATAAIVEYLSGIRGSNLIMVFYAVIICIELRYGAKLTPSNVRDPTEFPIRVGAVAAPVMAGPNGQQVVPQQMMIPATQMVPVAQPVVGSTVTGAPTAVVSSGAVVQMPERTTIDFSKQQQQTAGVTQGADSTVGTVDLEVEQTVDVEELNDAAEQEADGDAVTTGVVSPE